MTRLRVVAAIAALLTSLLLQGSVIGPAVAPAFLSLPAVLVAAIALTEGPGTGIAFGFAAGLIADLASDHATGILALCWLALGLVCGRLSLPASLRRDALVAAAMATVACTGAVVLMALTNSGGASVSGAFVHAVPAFVGDFVLAVAVVPLTRRFLRSEALRRPIAASPVLVLARWDR